MADQHYCQYRPAAVVFMCLDGMSAARPEDDTAREARLAARRDRYRQRIPATWSP